MSRGCTHGYWRLKKENEALRLHIEKLVTTLQILNEDKYGADGELKVSE